MLFGREGCHLCDQMEAALRELLRDQEYGLRVEDAESRDDWFRAYALRLPVLTAGYDGPELCEGMLDEVAVLDYVRQPCAGLG